MWDSYTKEIRREVVARTPPGGLYKQLQYLDLYPAQQKHQNSP